jgi:hypothetical protein
LADLNLRFLSRLSASGSHAGSQSLDHLPHRLQDPQVRSTLLSLLLRALTHRSSRRTLLPYLDLYGLEATLVPPSAYLHPSHCSSSLPSSGDGGCVVRIGEETKEQELPIFDDILLIRIQRKS